MSVGVGFADEDTLLADVSTIETEIEICMNIPLFYKRRTILPSNEAYVNEICFKAAIQINVLIKLHSVLDQEARIQEGALRIVYKDAVCYREQ